MLNLWGNIIFNQNEGMRNDVSDDCALACLALVACDDNDNSGSGDGAGGAGAAGGAGGEGGAVPRAVQAAKVALVLKVVPVAKVALVLKVVPVAKVALVLGGAGGEGGAGAEGGAGGEGGAGAAGGGGAGGELLEGICERLNVLASAQGCSEWPIENCLAPDAGPQNVPACVPVFHALSIAWRPIANSVAARSAMS